MLKLRVFIRRHAHWVGFLAALLPLVALVGLQYSWLAELERASAVAHGTTLRSYLNSVATGIDYFYRSNAERALNLPAWVFTQRYIRKAGSAIAKKNVEGAKRIFVLDLTDEHGDLWYYAPSGPTMVAAPEGPEARAIQIACAPWRELSLKQATVAPIVLSVDERDPEFRMILSPVTDDSTRLLGMAGYIVDEGYFKDVLFPAAVAKAVPDYFPGGEGQQFVVSVHDERGALVESTAEIADREPEVTLPLSFVFTDWQLGLDSGHASPEQWARANFMLNLSLLVLLAVVLLGGLLLALRTASREMRLSLMKSEFVSNVSHELRTPLASIRVFGEFLRLGRVQTPEKVVQYGQYIETESRRLTQLINNILDFSKIESDRKTYRIQPGDLQQVVSDVIKTFEVRLKESGFQIELEQPASPLPQVMMDADAMGQAVHNLLDNAVKYSGDSRQVKVRLGASDGRVSLAVEDQGIGISRQEQDKIFDRFHRVGTGLVHDIKGTGLGLAIVDHIVTAHGGTVSVGSEPGKGTVFTISLPATEKNVHAAAAQS